MHVLEEVGAEEGAAGERASLAGGAVAVLRPRGTWIFVTLQGVSFGTEWVEVLASIWFLISQTVGLLGISMHPVARNRCSFSIGVFLLVCGVSGSEGREGFHAEVPREATTSENKNQELSLQPVSDDREMQTAPGRRPVALQGRRAAPAPGQQAGGLLLRGQSRGASHCLSSKGFCPGKPEFPGVQNQGKLV